MKRLPLLALSLAVACGAPAPEDPAPAAAPAAEPAPDRAPNVILFIGDGTGTTYWSALKATSSMPLAIEAFPVVGLVDTEASNSKITDSAAGATAFSTGIRTFNGAVGVGPDSVPAETVLEIAERQGWSTGLVATSTITHATPASFAAHVPSRQMHRTIAEQMAEQGIEVLLGGGRSYFRGGATEQGAVLEDLVPGLRENAVYIEDADAFYGLSFDTVPALVGLFAETQPGSAMERSPNLAEMTRAALAVLERDDDGFFLMVEGSQIDWRGHENATLPELLAELHDFNMAIRSALVFQERNPNTLIVVTADHSTGGLAIHSDSTGQLAAHWTTDYHTVGMVPLFARGPHAELFAGVKDNDAVGRLLLQVVREGEAVSAP